MNFLEYLAGSGVVKALRRTKRTLMPRVVKALRRVKRMLMPPFRQQKEEEEELEKLEQHMLDVGPGVLEVALARFLRDSRPVEEEGEKAVLAKLIEWPGAK